jgi:cysteine desulfurase
MQEDAARLLSYRDLFWNAIKDLNGVRWNGRQENSLSHVANICFDLPGGDNLIKLLTKHMSVSSGSACSSAIVAPSHVLKAMGLTDQQAHASIRFSMGRFTTDEEVKMLVEEVTSALSRMQ